MEEVSGFVLPTFQVDGGLGEANDKTGFAIAENKALLAALVGSFELKSLVDEAVEPEILWGITAKLMDGLSVETKVVEGW